MFDDVSEGSRKLKVLLLRKDRTYYTKAVESDIIPGFYLTKKKDELWMEPVVGASVFTQDEIPEIKSLSELAGRPDAAKPKFNPGKVGAIALDGPGIFISTMRSTGQSADTNRRSIIEDMMYRISHYMAEEARNEEAALARSANIGNILAVGLIGVIALLGLQLIGPILDSIGGSSWLPW